MCIIDSSAPTWLSDAGPRAAVGIDKAMLIVGEVTGALPTAGVAPATGLGVHDRAASAGCSATGISAYGGS